jgi:hypothetical protein
LFLVSEYSRFKILTFTEKAQRTIIKLQKELNALEPREKRKKFRGRMFVPP